MLTYIRDTLTFILELSDQSLCCLNNFNRECGEKLEKVCKTDILGS